MTLALIAGSGALPPAILERLPERPLICALAGSAPAVTPDLTFRLERLGGFLADLTARGVTRICMAGAVARPEIDPLALDDPTRALLPRLRGALSVGDDGALRVVIAIFEESGFEIVAAHDVAPDLLPDAGVPTAVSPDLAHREDAVLGELTLAQMGAADIGQACILRGGHVLAREDAAGTDAMIRRFVPERGGLWAPADLLGDALGQAAEWLSGPEGSPVDVRGGILFKGPKPDQDRRVDLPVIGLETAQRAVEARLAGIVIEAGGVMVLDLGGVVDTLNRAGAFLWVRPKGGA
ncbi:LpxI family protein [Aestuariibius sp. 2305UL40-4]|uniref:LpxI family protein n=1 Tax=Aestuariibius violaceus TaxID=3234132 RepID=UPI00345E9E33